MWLFLHRLKKRIAVTTNVATDLAIFVGLVLIVGLGSSWYMVEAGNRLTTATVGPWVIWPAAGRRESDPYTRAHFSRIGALPLSTVVARTYTASSDSDGARLHSSCDYVVTGKHLANRWWSLSVFDRRGNLITNSINRHTFTRDTIALDTDGGFVATLSRDIGPGNWLPTGGAGRLAIVFTMVDTEARALTREVDDETTALPDIRRVRCR
jgi:hypothetical protein